MDTAQIERVVMDRLAEYPKARRYLRERAQLSLSEIADLFPTGNENVNLMRRVIVFAKKDQKRPWSRRRFAMGEWFSGNAVRSGQKDWCGTRACLAGTAAVMALPDGWKIFGERAIVKPNDAYVDFGVEEMGRDVLGLTGKQAHVLFYMSSARLATITEVASVIVGEDLR